MVSVISWIYYDNIRIMTLLKGNLSIGFTVSAEHLIRGGGEGKGEGWGWGCCAERREIFMVTTTTQTYSDRKTSGQFHGYKLF